MWAFHLRSMLWRICKCCCHALSSKHLPFFHQMLYFICRNCNKIVAFMSTYTGFSNIAGKGLIYLVVQSQCPFTFPCCLPTVCERNHVHLRSSPLLLLFSSFSSSSLTLATYPVFAPPLKSALVTDRVDVLALCYWHTHTAEDEQHSGLLAFHCMKYH